MKRRFISMLLAISMLLGGCSWLDGSYVQITPHQEQTVIQQPEVISASDYGQLLDILEEMVNAGKESGIINVTDYDQDVVEFNMRSAALYIREKYPIGAYAVEAISCEVGTNGTRPAIAVNITYRHSPLEIRRIRKVKDMEEARLTIGQAMQNFESSVVLEIESYREADFAQMVENYAQEHPETVMESPQVTWEIYGKGVSKVAELGFSYRTNRDSLRAMRSQVKLVFDSAALYVSGEGAPRQKFSQLYSFLMERFDYTQETSITPAYSLLRHGVGDSRAFAVVYASMCRQAGLECMIVTGTRNGEPWTWNIVSDNGYYYHVDLLRSSESGGFREFTDGDMQGYVWDYSDYPVCKGAGKTQPAAKPTTAPAEEPTETTSPEETTKNFE